MTVYRPNGGSRSPKGSRSNPRRRLAFVLGGALLVTSLSGAALAYYGTSDNLDVGYCPTQPVEFSHKVHAGDLGIDCRFCHVTVERSAFAALPSTQICMKCHSKVRTDSVKLLPIRATFAADRPIAWNRVHKLADHVYFDHSAHLAVGVGCSTCHGRVDQMHRVQQVQPLSMGWCIDCHRNPLLSLRPTTEVTNMNWEAGAESLSPGATRAAQPRARAQRNPMIRPWRQ